MGLADLARRAHQPKRGAMPVPRKGRRANYPSSIPDAIARGLRRDSVEIATKPTLESLDRYDPIVHPGWKAHAACRGMGPERFFPTSGDGLAPARQICALSRRKAVWRCGAC